MFPGRPSFDVDLNQSKKYQTVPAQPTSTLPSRVAALTVLVLALSANLMGKAAPALSSNNLNTSNVKSGMDA